MRFNQRDDVNRLDDWLGPVLGVNREGAAGLVLCNKHAVQSNVDYTNSGRKILHEAGDAAFESVAAVNMQGDGNIMTQLDSYLFGISSYNHIGCGRDGS